MLTEQAAELLTALRRTLSRWDCTVDGNRVAFSRAHSRPHQPPRRVPPWRELLEALGSACVQQGIDRCDPLPLRGLGDAGLTFSAVQALDPYVKHRRSHTYRSGFVPQPVVRFTGDRDKRGALRPGYLTSFVNVSLVQPIAAPRDHAALIDTWLSILSHAGFHARHIAIVGTLRTWRRREVAGVTLMFQHSGRPVGDAVLLWNVADPAFLATDIGSGLERLRWSLSRRSWADVIYGGLGAEVDTDRLDALRTATLIVGSGIRPAPRGPGSALRRLLRSAGDRSGTLGLSRVVRWGHEYWSMVKPLPVPWPDVCRVLETETFNG